MYPLSTELCLTALMHHTQKLHLLLNILHQANTISGKAMSLSVGWGFEIIPDNVKYNVESHAFWQAEDRPFSSCCITSYTVGYFIFR